MADGFWQDVNQARASLVAEEGDSAGSGVAAYHQSASLAGPATTPYLMSVTEAARLLGWGRTKLYHAIQRGYFTAGVVHVGTSISISRPALFRWLETVGHTDAPPTSTR